VSGEGCFSFLLGHEPAALKTFLLPGKGMTMFRTSGLTPQGLAAVRLAAFGIRGDDGEWRLPAAVAAASSPAAHVATLPSQVKSDAASSPAAHVAPLHVPPAAVATLASQMKSDAASSPAAHVAQPAPHSTRDAWAAEWDASEILQAEFDERADYVAFKAAEAGGRIRFLGSLPNRAQGAAHVPPSVATTPPVQAKSDAVSAPPAAMIAQPVTPSTRDAWAAEWDASEVLQAEFDERADYVAFKAAEAGGRIRLLAPSLARQEVLALHRRAALPPLPASAANTRDGWLAEWKASPALQNEFAEADWYIAYRHNEKNGERR
jgi:hypothetical protein